jgi:hypothetical protein
MSNLKALVERIDTHNDFNQILNEYFVIIDAEWIIDPSVAVLLANKAIANPSGIKPELLIYTFLHASYVSGQHHLIFEYCRPLRTSPPPRASSLRQFMMYCYEKPFMEQLLRQGWFSIDDARFTCSRVTPKAVVMTACDDIYYHKYLIDELESLAVPADVVFHIAVIDASVTTLEHLRSRVERHKWFSFSEHASDEYHRLVDHTHISSVEQRVTLYACHRFFIAHAILNKYNVPVIVCDADTDFAGCELQEAVNLACSSDADVALAKWANDSSPGLAYTADVMVFYPTINSMRFLSLVCRYLLFHIKSNLSFWTLDQVALNATDKYMRTVAESYQFLDLATHPIKQRQLFRHKGSTEFRQEAALVHLNAHQR